jgi:hypothetical protein
MNSEIFDMKPIYGSSQIDSAGHDEGSDTLQICFVNGGTYQYDNVTREQFDELMSAPSAGAWFAKNIKRNPKNHPYTKIIELES